jgi:hypothetical protein
MAIVLVVSVAIVHVVGVATGLHRLMATCAVVPVIVVLGVLLMLVHGDRVCHPT